MHAGCQSASTGLSETLLFTWELCKLRYRLWINNKKASLMLLHFGFQVFSQGLVLGSENSIFL